jgi:hypothetical protein
MGAIHAGQLTAFFLFDVAEAADLVAVQRLAGHAGQPARLAKTPAMPAYVQYQAPPVQLDGRALGVEPIEGYQARLKIYDYGVLSLSLTRPFSGEWEALARLGQHASSPELESRAEAYCRAALARVTPALHMPRESFLSEDYVVFAITAVDDVRTSEALLARHGDDIARVLRGELESLSSQEREEVLRHRLSYLETDLVVPSWNTAFVFDTEAGLAGALELLEFANSQLLQYRYYDQRLDDELRRIYARLQVTRWYEPWVGRRYTAAARELHALFIDVNELTDRTENALKLVGDVYAARLLGLAGARLGLGAWKDAVRDKLKTLDDIYRFAVDQTSMDRGEILEAAIVLILVFELVLFFMGIMK